jgi:nucleoside 2-deoxyribosyltransferase
MILRGLLDRSLSNQICVRGFARIKELARVSKADPDYQRELIDKQKKVISNFLTDENYLFFPEVILSLKLRYDLTISDANKNHTPIQIIESNKQFKSNVDTLKISSFKKKLNTFDINENNSITIIDIEIDDIELMDLINSNKHPFHRIDGNHRLTAAERIIDNDRINTMNIPFCIVLFEELTREKFIPGSGTTKIIDKSYEKFERVVFYNINSKSIPLTLEQNLKGILGEEQHFNNEEILKIFGKEGVNARKLGNRLNHCDFNSLKSILKSNKWAICLNLFHLSSFYNTQKKPTISILIENLFTSFQAINVLYGENTALRKNKNADILIAFVYAKTFFNISTFRFFSKWLINHHFFKIEEITTKSILGIFNKINEKTNITVFVAMPYWTHALVTEYNKLFKEILTEIQKTSVSNLELELIPIMRFKGESKRIDIRLLEKIRECDVFIADLTDCYPNVCFEIAFAEGCEKPMILIKKEKDKSVPPFDMDKLQWIPYDGKTYYNSIKAIIKNNLKEILKTKWEIE